MTAGSSQQANGGEGEFVLTAAAIAEAVRGQLIGDPGVLVRGIAPLDRAGPGELSFLGAARYAAAFSSTGAAVVLVSPDLADSPGAVPARIVVERPQEALLALLPRFHQPLRPPPGVHPTAVVGQGVVIAPAVSVGPFVVLGDGVRLGDGAIIGAHCVVGENVEIGDGAQLYPSVTVYAGSRVGARVTAHSGVRIGSDGFGYVQRGGQHLKIPHVGRCIIEDDVEIGANTTIDRGSIDDTVIGAGTKIDNLVQIGHNVRIGKGCLIMAQVGIAGSTHVGNGVILAGQAGLGGHRTIGDGARVAGQAGVFGDIPAGETWSGYPARPHKEALRAQAALLKLPPLLRRIERLLDTKPGSE